MTALLELPSPETVREAQTALRQLAPIVEEHEPSVHVRVAPDDAEGGEPVTVPRQAFELFLEVLGQLANGNAVTIVPVHAELTTQQAAELLNVSRPHLIALLERGAIPYRKVGAHRRISASDLLAYRERDAAERRRTMDELTAEAQRLGLGY